MVYIASRYAPTFDLGNPMHALRFAIFLLYVRHEHSEKLVELFRKRRDDFQGRWAARDPTLRWTLKQQREDNEAELSAVRTRQEEAVKRYREVF